MPRGEGLIELLEQAANKEKQERHKESELVADVVNQAGRS